MDRFDRIIHKCKILDIEEKIDCLRLFEIVSEEMESSLNIPKKYLLRLFKEREEETSTIILPWLAIPHIILEGDNIFEIVVIRAKKGILFNNHDEKITTAFIIAGSMNERNFHLKSLMIIAHIVNEDEFKERWLNAKDREQLRDVLLLSERKRLMD